MKLKNLYIMCGIPGAGKSTWLVKNAKDGVIISRDQIRFELVPESEEYFSKEEEVFRTFVTRIQSAIDNPVGFENVYCDATHINKASRDKLINALDLSNVSHVTVLVVRPSLEETLKRDGQRTGRSYVSKSVVCRMWYQFERPEEDEDRIFDVKYVEVPG